MATEQVIIVDKNDNAIDTAEKLAAHQQNLLHRAFSVFIFRDSTKRELLIQQRAMGKYHCPGLWTNTCCSHPRPGENILAAGKRRLQEELGFEAELSDLGWFHYNAHFDNGLSENEIDHVLVGVIGVGVVITPNAGEIHAVRWVNVEDLQSELKENPEKFTPWLEKALEIVKSNE
jgi:isopentenyl-diphosphate delta-isomerase type 1